MAESLEADSSYRPRVYGHFALDDFDLHELLQCSMVIRHDYAQRRNEAHRQGSESATE